MFHQIREKHAHDNRPYWRTLYYSNKVMLSMSTRLVSCPHRWEPQPQPEYVATPTSLSQVTRRAEIIETMGKIKIGKIEYRAMRGNQSR